MKKDFLEVGEIVGTHGVRGEMRVNPWCDSPAFLKKFKKLYLDEKGEKSLDVKGAREHWNVALLVVDGVDTVEKAQAMRGKVLYIKRDDARLQKGNYFIAELIDCTVYDADDETHVYGVISDVSETGANDVWHIEKDGKEYLIPAIKDVVISVDVEEGRILIRPMKGIFDDEN